MFRAPLAGVVAACLGVCTVGASTAAATPPASSTHGRTIQVWLAGREQAAQRFVDAVSTPGSPAYHRFVSPIAYTQRFGPGGAQVRAVSAYLTRAGFTRVRVGGDGEYVSATGTAATGGRESVPAAIAADVLSVTGTGVASPPVGDATTAAAPARTRTTECSRYWAQKTRTVTPAFHGLTRAAVPVCGYSAGQIRAAYGLSSANTGRGVTVAIIGDGAPFELLRTLDDYSRANGLPTLRAGQLRQQAVTAGPHPGRPCPSELQESQIDSESAHATAPGADLLFVAGNSCDTAEHGNQVLLDALLAPLTGHGSEASAQIESSSFGVGEASPAVVRAFHAIALRAAAEGVSLLVDTGDSPGVEQSPEDPDVTAVGGTTLGIGAHDHRLFETGWSDLTAVKTQGGGRWRNPVVGLGAGGGVSSAYPEPSYQRSVVPAAMAQDRAGHPGRTVPDISADADPFSGLRFGYINPLRGGRATPYGTFVDAGTSAATPLVAGMVADAEEGQPKSFGFLNPLLYSLAGSAAFHDILPVSASSPDVDRAWERPTEVVHGRKETPAAEIGVIDAQGAGLTKQVTAPGYDTMTGLGTPNGAAFMAALRSGR